LRLDFGSASLSRRSPPPRVGSDARLGDGDVIPLQITNAGAMAVWRQEDDTSGLKAPYTLRDRLFAEPADLLRPILDLTRRLNVTERAHGH
jgi:hypothetical protein